MIKLYRAGVCMFELYRADTHVCMFEIYRADVCMFEIYRADVCMFEIYRADVCMIYGRYGDSYRADVRMVQYVSHFLYVFISMSVLIYVFPN